MVAGLLAVTAVVAGCGGAKTEPDPQSAPSTTAGTPTPHATTSTPRATASATTGESITAIKTAYVRFFNPKTSLKESVTLLQDGPAFKKTLKTQAKTDFAQTSTATVSTVTLTSPNRATVVYTILLSGSPVLEDTIGSAVHESGKWKVAGATFCGLLTAQGPPPAVCAQAAATTAPYCSIRGAHGSSRTPRCNESGLHSGI
jgi:hypothetical protein